MKTNHLLTDRKKVRITQFFLILSLIVLLMSIHCYNRIIEIGDEIKICKDNGYDGVKFISQWNTKLECSNMTILEKVRTENSLDKLKGEKEE